MSLTALGLPQVLLDVGRWDAAIQNFQTEARLRPDLSAPLLSIAKAYHRLGQLDRAAASAEAATKVEPSSSAAWNGAGSAPSRLAQSLGEDGWLLIRVGQVVPASCREGETVCGIAQEGPQPSSARPCDVLPPV